MSSIRATIKKHIALFNVIVLGISFLLVFGAFQTAAMSEQSVLEEARNESHGTFKGSGYTRHRGFLSYVFGGICLLIILQPPQLLRQQIRHPSQDFFTASTKHITAKVYCLICWKLYQYIALFIDPLNSVFSERNLIADLSVIYATFAFSNWFAPFIVVLIGPRISMLLTSIIYNLYIASFLKPMTWSLYLGSVLVGCAAAVIWTAQGKFLSLNSNQQTISRNSGLFWAIFQTSLLFGNLYQYFAFKGETTISDSTRFHTFLILTIAGFIGSGVFLLLRPPPIEESIENEREVINDALVQDEADDRTPMLQNVEAPQTPFNAFVRSFSLFLTRDMLMLMAMFAYTGFELTFFSGVYGTCLGHTKVFGDSAKSYIGLSGVFIGVGEILGGVLFSYLGRRALSRGSITTIGYVVHMICFFLIFLNLPAASTLKEAEGNGYITPNVIVGMLCAFMLGFGDSSFNTQVMSLLGDVYAGRDCTSAFALYKFMQSLAAAAGFFYSTYLLLHWQLLIMVISGTVGTALFSIVDGATTQGDLTPPR